MVAEAKDRFPFTLAAYKKLACQRANPYQFSALLVVLLLFFTTVVPAQPVSDIASGRFHSFFLRSDGSLWAMGENAFGQLGDGLFTMVTPYGTNLPVRCQASNVIAVAAGSHHSLYIQSDHSLWGMGLNPGGQLGDVPPTSSIPVTGEGINPPVRILSAGVVAVAAADAHTLVLKEDTSLWGMGVNRYGQLGDGTTNDCLVPIRIVASGVTAIAANNQQSFFVKDDGSLWAMGYNTFGQLGTGDYGTGHYTNTPVRILASNVMAVGAGANHTLVLKKDGSLWGMGNNSYKQLGDGMPGIPVTPSLIVSNGVQAIAAGFSHSLFLRTDGTLWGMGDNSNGQLGDGTYTQVNHPKPLVSVGVVAVACKNAHTLFLKDDSSLWAMGNNSHGELGDGTFSNANQPEQIVGPFQRIDIHPVDTGSLRLRFTGIAEARYALDHSPSLSPSAWLPLETNRANSWGNLLFTNPLPAAGNDFWRVRSVP